ncbi:hypothetical protein SELMODRAFT_431538 [Selaginella moellendorffii]|uniref:Uncharacterized protein n=1 Tax=Selaginella moellendorffii TaxID=88036 RepID=D8TCZ8_SELML|nr:hypothetical protein SELMODRAFT_431538 [Selaginella moellendorffii]
MVEMKTHGKKTVEGELITAAAHHEISMEQNRQLLPESLDGIAYIDMILYFAIQLGREIAIIHLKSQADFFQFFMPNNGMALLSLSHTHWRLSFLKLSDASNKRQALPPSSIHDNWLQEDDSLEQCTGSLHRNTGNIQNNPALEVHLAGTSLVVSWNEGYVGSSNGVHALKFIPQLLQVYFNVALQDMSDSLLCTLLPMVFFRIKAMFPDKAFSIEVSLSYLFEVVIPKEVKTLQKPITSQPQTSDSKTELPLQLC